ncbi:MAG: helix-turn-helix transcriptional regulator [Terracidiphilus sp.]
MNKKSTDKVAQVEDLKKRLIAVRGSATQRAFANALGVSQPTIATWEKGDERPARERFLDLAKLASTKEERLWFLKEAGVDLGLVKSDLREDAADRMEALDEISREDRDSLAAVPVVQISELLSPKNPASPGEGSLDKLHISARHLANAGDAVAFGIRSNDTLFLPFWLDVNDLILIDRGTRLLRDFFMEDHHRGLHLAAVLIPHGDLFTHHSVGNFNLIGHEKLDRQMEERRAAVAKQQAIPVLMVGRFEEEIAGAEAPRIPNETDLCRLIFVPGNGAHVPLTEWAQGTVRRDMGPGIKLLHDARIVGAVSGWISSPRAIGLKERTAENVRRYGKPLPPGQSLLRPTGR